MFNSSAFPLEQAINFSPLTVTPDTPVFQAIALMSQARVSCVLVVDSQFISSNHAGKLLGIFTEESVVKITESQQCLAGVAIAQVMTQQPVTLDGASMSDLMTVLNIFAQHQLRHLPIVDNNGQLLGLIARHRIKQILKPADCMRLKQVFEAMTSEVVHAPLSASILEVTQRMAKERVSCVVICELGSTHRQRSLKEQLIPVGIITERDIVQFQALGLNLSQTKAQTVMSSPLIPIRPEDSLWDAHNQMQQYRVRRLVVVGDEGELVGIVTQTSIMRSLDPMEMKASVTSLQKLLEERTSKFWQAYKGLHHEIRQHRQTELALRESQARLFGILDIANDAIISINENQQIQLFNKGAEKIFGYSAAEVLGKSIDLLLLARFQVAHRQHINDFYHSNDVARNMGERREIMGRCKDGTTFPAEASISKLQLEQEIILTVILRDITERKQAEEALRNQLARERLLGAIALRIHQSLDLDIILNTTVAEVRQFLACDRVIIYRFASDWSGFVVVESVTVDWSPILGTTIKDPCFSENYAQLYQAGRIQTIEDINKASIPKCYRDLLAPLQVKANLVVPILGGIPMLDSQPHAAPSSLWGLLAAHQCSEPRCWQEWEVDLLKQLATQVAIAIQQAELYQQLVTANQRLEQLVAIDGLTQVANRRRFDEYLDKEWLNMVRDKHPLTIILCDVDCFKAYNDTYGHVAGDLCLQQVAGAIRKSIRRPADLVARYGGEEFAVILPNTPPEGAVCVAAEMQSRIRALKIPHSQSIVSEYITISIGVATTIPSNQCSKEMLIEQADRALYQAKAQGRDRIVYSENAIAS